MINQSALQIAQDFEDLAHAADDILSDTTMTLSRHQTEAVAGAKERLRAAADPAAVHRALRTLKAQPADFNAIAGATEEANETMAYIKANAAALERSLFVLAGAVNLSQALAGTLSSVRVAAAELFQAATFYQGAAPRPPASATPVWLDDPETC